MKPPSRPGAGSVTAAAAPQKIVRTRAPTSAPVSNRQEMVWGGLLRTPGAPAPSRYLVGYVFTGAVLMWKQLNGSVQRYWAAQHSCVPSPDLRVRRSSQQNKIGQSFDSSTVQFALDRIGRLRGLTSA